jgi:hypothetical protein
MALRCVFPLLGSQRSTEGSGQAVRLGGNDLAGTAGKAESAAGMNRVGRDRPHGRLLPMPHPSFVHQQTRRGSAVTVLDQARRPSRRPVTAELSLPAGSIPTPATAQPTCPPDKHRREQRPLPGCRARTSRSLVVPQAPGGCWRWPWRRPGTWPAPRQQCARGAARTGARAYSRSQGSGRSGPPPAAGPLHSGHQCQGTQGQHGATALQAQPKTGQSGAQTRVSKNRGKPCRWPCEGVDLSQSAPLC